MTPATTTHRGLFLPFPFVLSRIICLIFLKCYYVKMKAAWKQWNRYFQAEHTMQTFEGTEVCYHQSMYLQCVGQSFAYLHCVCFLFLDLKVSCFVMFCCNPPFSPWKWLLQHTGSFLQITSCGCFLKATGWPITDGLFFFFLTQINYLLSCFCFYFWV